MPEFAKLWNDQQGLPTPKHHVAMGTWLEGHWAGTGRRLLMMAFRSSGKSTMVGLFCAWLLVRDPNLRILVLAADLALAKKMVRTVKRIVERHRLTQDLRPERADQWAAEQFTVNRRLELRDPSMLARGIGANVTGSRADVVICDDVEVPRTSGTAAKREELRERLSEIDYVLVPGGLQLYVGTPHSYYTIYADAPRAEAGETRPFLSGFERFELPILDAQGASAWPERFTPEAIARIRRASGPNKFRSQMMLEPADVADGRLDPDRLRPYEAELDYAETRGGATLRLEGRRLVSASCWWDPAWGGRDTGDGSVVAVVFGDGEGRQWLHRLRYLSVERSDPADEATQQCREVARFLAEMHLSQVGVETNGLGRFLPALLRKELAVQGVSATVVEQASTRPKHERIIEAFDALLAAGALAVHRGVWRTPFIREMREWRPGAGSRAADDGLDAVALCLLAEPVRLGPVPRPPRAPDWRGRDPAQADTEFEV
jgi:hypothetical protein